MADTASVFAEIVKTAPQEDGSLLVQGRASDSSLDLDQQICDPKWLARAMPAWFEIGNIREQHDPRRAVGKATEYDARDDGGHYITASIVDPVAKAKTLAGIFTGFSIGVKAPRIAKSATAPGGVIHDGQIVEVSLVDRPANPSTTLTLVKAAEPGWEGKPDDVDDARGLVHVEELHLGADADVTKTDTPDTPADADGEAAPELDAETAAVVQDIAELAAALNINDADRAAVLAGAIEKASQVEDIAAAQDAIRTIGGLIASEASELVTCPSEVYDITLLLEAVRALQRFIRCEENEGDRRSDDLEPMVAMAAAADLQKRKWSKAERDRAVREGHARPDGSFPIETAEDVQSAVHLARTPEDRAWVKRRARAVGAENKIPDTWKGAMSDKTNDTTTTAGEAHADTADPPQTPDGGDPATEQAQSPSMDSPGDQADPDDEPADDGDTDKAGRPSGKPFGRKPAADDEDDDSDDEDDEDTGKNGKRKGKPFKPFTKAGSPDLVKALTTALTDTDSELRKTLTAIVEDSTRSTAATLTELVGRVEQVEQMAAPGGPALRRTEHDRATARHADLAQQAAHYKALELAAEDPDLRHGYHVKAAAADAELRTLSAALA